MKRVVIVCGVVFLAATCQAGVIHVDGDAPGANNGTSWSNAYRFLQDAMAAAVYGDIIQVAQGTYQPDANTAYPSGTSDRNATFTLKNGVTIQGGYAGYGQADPNVRDIAAYETILSGDLNGDDGPNFANNGENSYHVVKGGGTDSSAVLDGLVITAGNANGTNPQNCGGGIYNSGGSPTISNCTFSNNSASNSGGGIYKGSSTITSCLFICNTSAKYGGALCTCYGPISNCSFVGNYSSLYGGAIYDCSGPVVGCKIAGNTAGNYGGGVYEYMQSGSFINCTFTGNSAIKGGGVYTAFRNVDVRNCTFTGNSASQTGGGIWVGQATYLTMFNSIMWGDSPSEIYSNNGTPAVTYNDIQGGWSGEGNIDEDPLFVDANGADNIIGTEDDYPALLSGSACIDAGDNNAVPIDIVTDINGNPRIINNAVDMGAYEGDSSGPVIRVSPMVFEFSANEGGSNPEDQMLTVRNYGTGTLNWQIGCDCEWLSAEPNSGISTGEINEVALSVDISGLAGGIYDCNLTVSDPCASNNPKIIAVNLNITGPLIELSAMAFAFDANEGGGNPAEQIFTVRNSGGGTVNWTISYDCNWLSVEPNSGSSTGEADEVTLAVDIDGLEEGVYDCNFIVSDPNAGNSPRIVNVMLDLTEVWRDYIVFPDDPLISEVIFEGDPRWVKFTIKLDDPCEVYFQNSKLYEFHYHFATEWLEPFTGMSVPEYFDVTLYDANQQASLGAVIFPPTTGNPPEPEFAEYGIQFVRYDPYTKEEISAMFMAVKTKVIADPCVTAYYFPTYEQQQVAKENEAWFASQGIPIGSIAQWIEGNICYSEGWAIGELKYFPGDQIQSAYLNGDLLPEDILLTDGVPAEVPFVAGIITLSPSTQNSHVAILSKTYGIPFVYLAAESDVNTVWQLVNDLTLLCVQEESGICSVQLKDAMATFTPEEIDVLFVMKELTPLDIAPMAAYGSYGANTDNLLPEDIEHFGGKAANYGMLRQSIPDNVPVAAALSFDVWNEFMNQPLTPSESVIIPSYGYVVFWADDQQEQGARHTSFKLSKSGEDVGLFNAEGSLIDGFSFVGQTTDVSYGRTPDGNDNWTFFYGGDISPNAPNPGGAGVTGAGLFINEFMADNDTIAADEYGEYDDWIEIYNSNSAAVDLGGMYLTDDIEAPTKWMISVGISGSTLGEEIANRLAGYTYPVSDLAGLSAELAAIRNIITNPNITTFSPQLQNAIKAVLQDPNYGFDPNKNIRFRSSTNVEDAEKFTGAGLYDSYSGCLADDLDGDESGPCRCDPNESNERGVFRAIRKVLASFYNDNAYLERLRRDVDEADVGMAMLVHHSFPDEIELANGVATMEKKLSPPHWDIKLVTQKGATPVTNPEEGALPEEVSVYAEPGGGMSMTLIRQSNLVILGEKVMEWQADYNELVDLLVAAAERFETVTGKTEYILDLEYKKVAADGAVLPAGGIEVDQIREIPPLDDISSACPSFDYSCTCTSPGDNRFVEHSYEDPVTGVSIETSYCLNCPSGYVCMVYDLSYWCRTVIRGYTTKPIVLLSSASQSYSASHHNWCEDFLFTPHFEPGMDQCLLRQLRAKDIRVIHLGKMTACGAPYVETFGFGAGPYYLGDFEPDGDVDMVDFAIFAQRWLNSNCGQCGGADFDCDAKVEMEDLAEFVNNWLAE